VVVWYLNCTRIRAMRPCSRCALLLILGTAVAPYALVGRSALMPKGSFESVGQTLDSKCSVSRFAYCLCASRRRDRFLELLLAPYEEGGGDIGRDAGMPNARLAGPRLDSRREGVAAGERSHDR
jgi:hypothetical protein